MANAVRDNPERAEFVGYSQRWVRFVSFCAAGFFAGVAGGLFAHFDGYLNPSSFTFLRSIEVVTMVVLGGMGSVRGVVVGAVILSAVNHWLLPRVLHDVPSKVGLDFDLAEISAGIYGFLLLLTMLVRPEGLLPERRHRMALELRERGPVR
jgi:branched-chain amino acid transport system permease protein